MKTFGKVTNENGQWFLEDNNGKKWELQGVKLPARVAGQTVEVIGTPGDAFGLGMFDVVQPLHVGQIRVV